MSHLLFSKTTDLFYKLSLDKVRPRMHQYWNYLSYDDLIRLDIKLYCLEIII